MAATASDVFISGAQAQLSALDDQFQTKLAAEAERYEELLRDKEALNERWDEQNKQLLLQHERLLEEVTADCDAKVQVRAACALVRDTYHHASGFCCCTAAAANYVQECLSLPVWLSRSRPCFTSMYVPKIVYRVFQEQWR